MLALGAKNSNSTFRELSRKVTEEAYIIQVTGEAFIPNST